MSEKRFVGQIKEQAEKVSLDIIDRKIVYLLCKNARFSDTAIAKALNLRRETVSYRIKSMMEKDFLHGCLTLIDSRRLGFRMHLIYLKLKRLDKEQSIINSLMGKEHVTRLKDCAGSYDIQIVVTTKNAEEFDDFLKSLLSRFSDLIQDYDVLEIIDENFAGMEMILKPQEKIGLKITEKKGSSFEAELRSARRVSDKVDIDEKDRKMLEILRLDGRATIAEISKKIGLAPPAVENRIRRLVKEDVIKAFIPYASLSHLGYQWYKAFFRVKDLDERKFITYLKQHANILWYIRFVGKWNYQFSIFAKDNAEFNRIINEIRSEFGENIIAYDSIIVFNQHKFVHRV